MIRPVTFEALEKMLGITHICAVETDHQRRMIRLITNDFSGAPEGQAGKQEMVITASDVRYGLDD